MMTSMVFRTVIPRARRSPGRQQLPDLPLTAQPEQGSQTQVNGFAFCFGLVRGICGWYVRGDGELRLTRRFDFSCGNKFRIGFDEPLYDFAARKQLFQERSLPIHICRSILNAKEDSRFERPS